MISSSFFLPAEFSLKLCQNTWHHSIYIFLTIFQSIASLTAFSWESDQCSHTGTLRRACTWSSMLSHAILKFFKSLSLNLCLVSEVHGTEEQGARRSGSHAILLHTISPHFCLAAIAVCPQYPGTSSMVPSHSHCWSPTGPEAKQHLGERTAFCRHSLPPAGEGSE